MFTSWSTKANLECFWNESIWGEIQVQRQIYLLSALHSPHTSEISFFDSLNKNVVRALYTANTAIGASDMNEDSLKDILILSSLNNIIFHTTRLALLDPS